MNTFLSPLYRWLLFSEKQRDALEIMCLSYCRNTRTIKGATNYFGEPIHYWANRKLDQYAWDELVAHSRMNELGTQIDFVMPPEWYKSNENFVYLSMPLSDAVIGVDILFKD